MNGTTINIDSESDQEHQLELTPPPSYTNEDRQIQRNNPTRRDLQREISRLRADLSHQKKRANNYKKKYIRNKNKLYSLRENRLEEILNRPRSQT